MSLTALFGGLPKSQQHRTHEEEDSIPDDGAIKIDSEMSKYAG
jgi:hypothetical protein